MIEMPSAGAAIPNGVGMTVTENIYPVNTIVEFQGEDDFALSNEVADLTSPQDLRGGVLSENDGGGDFGQSTTNAVAANVADEPSVAHRALRDVSFSEDKSALSRTNGSDKDNGSLSLADFIGDTGAALLPLAAENSFTQNPQDALSPLDAIDEDNDTLAHGAAVRGIDTLGLTPTTTVFDNVGTAAALSLPPPLTEGFALVVESSAAVATAIPEDTDVGNAVASALSVEPVDTPGVDPSTAGAIPELIAGVSIEASALNVTVLRDSDGDQIPDNADNAIFVSNSDQRDSNGDGYGNVIDADLNGDKVIDVEDLLIFRVAFGATGLIDGTDPRADADFDGDGVVDVVDLLAFRGLFGKPLGASYVDAENTPPSVALENLETTLAENADTTLAIRVATIAVTDDGLGVNGLSLTGADADLFEIFDNAGSLELRLVAGAALDFETNPSLDVTVEVDDDTVGASPDASAPFSVAVTDVDGTGPAAVLTTVITSLPENADTGAAIVVATIETNPSLDVTVEVDDDTVGASPDASAPFTVTVTPPENAAPTAVTLTPETISLPENADTTAAIKVADIAVTDDGLGMNVLSLTGADADLFEIVDNAGSLELRLVAGAALDFETNPSLDVTVEVDDATVGASPDASAPFTVAVTDVDENFGPITLDGALADWAGDQARHAAVDDGDTGYAAYGTYQAGAFVFALSADDVIGQDTTIWLDTDRRSRTGFNVFDAVGAEYNINLGPDGCAALYTGAARRLWSRTTSPTSSTRPQHARTRAAV